jgi:hypothetical protein
MLAWSHSTEQPSAAGLAARVANASPTDQLVRNALLEAFTIHVRQLIDFFWSERSSKWKQTQQGAYAADYFEPGEWRRLRPQRPQMPNRPLSGKVGWAWRT